MNCSPDELKSQIVCDFSEYLDPMKLSKDQVPKEIGLYAWLLKSSHRVVYIGSATGRNGLYGRIIAQHLNPNYLETRTTKHTEKVMYQLQHPIVLNGKIGIDKSAFRKNVARYHELKAGLESVEFLKGNYLLWLGGFARGEKDVVKALEIALIKDMKPQFNITHCKNA